MIKRFKGVLFPSLLIVPRSSLKKPTSSECVLIISLYWFRPQKGLGTEVGASSGFTTVVKMMKAESENVSNFFSKCVHFFS